jgi:hypothetical protein
MTQRLPAGSDEDLAELQAILDSIRIGAYPPLAAPGIRRHRWQSAADHEENP